MSLTDPTFEKFLKQVAIYFRIETYARDGGHVRPRKRLEVSSRIPDDIMRRMIDFQMPCVCCGRWMNPFRQRAGAKLRSTASRHIYFAAACPLDVSIRCSRTPAASDEYIKVAAAVTKLQENP